MDNETTSPAAGGTDAGLLETLSRPGLIYRCQPYDLHGTTVFDCRINSERKIVIPGKTNSEKTQETTIQCASPSLCKEKANTQWCDVTSPSNMAAVGDPRSDPQPPRLTRYPGTTADVMVESDTSVFFAVRLGVTPKTPGKKEIAEVAVGPLDRDLHCPVSMGEGGAGALCWLGTSGEVQVDGCCRGKIDPRSTWSVTAPPGQRTQLRMGFLVRGSTLTVYDVSEPQSLCRIEHIPLPARLYLGFFNQDAHQAELSIERAEDLELTPDFLKLLVSDV